ncbi:hypothetical protein [Paludisphaera soli]|uniref:hypothetical protein n=1 Tax=Paludisphaera soli TaxID=2712865 RepID=UPI0013EAF89B|nr:hypothetical protein [Paludisphaera soli]
MAKTKSLGEQMESKGEPYQRFPVAELLFDAENPRLAEYVIDDKTTQFDLLRILWQKMAIEEVAMSIAYNGYFVHEPLFIEKQGAELVVIEGNRRLAAVKLLLDKSLRERLRATDLPQISEERHAELQTIPAIVTTREEVWRYLGFKHVNGPSSWGSYAKAQYVAKVHHNYGVPLEEIARQIGDYNSTVYRMYRGLMVIEQAEKSGVFDRQEISKPSFYFNYIYTAIDYPGFTAFLGLGSKTTTLREPVPKSRTKQLGEVLEWLYGNSTRDKPSLIHSQNPDLKVLDTVLMSKQGVDALRDGFPLGVAKDISLGDEKLFRQALQQAKQELQKAHGTLSTGYTASDVDLLRIAQDVEELASDLMMGMMQKRKRAKRESDREKASDE